MEFELIRYYVIMTSHLPQYSNKTPQFIEQTAAAIRYTGTAKEKKKKLTRYDKSHICPEHIRCATPTKVVMRGEVTDVVNHTKFLQNRFRGFGSLRQWLKV